MLEEETTEVPALGTVIIIKIVNWLNIVRKFDLAKPSGGNHK
jgi:hypothetical protein